MVSDARYTHLQGYELAEDEVKISFDQFDLQFSDMEGFAK